MKGAGRQTGTWQGGFGRGYTDRNRFSVAALDALYLERYGISRTKMNEEFIGELPRELKILEVGCNAGNQLAHLLASGFLNIYGIDLQGYALRIAQERLRRAAFAQGSAVGLPFAEGSFDLVFTSGVLIHLPPEVLDAVLVEIYRCTRRYIWGLEYYAGEVTPINYRGHDDLLWKADYADMFLRRFPDLEIVGRTILPYLESENRDEMFLLQKVGAR